ncbi:hypothetical protein CGD37_22260, partial [Salmonella enterica subsp. enterica serovar Cerro]|nr:hypothetical protein [Salmonella enterica]EBW0441199.1 hypothetical protein [Salmonella enterica subsp. enterica serovar Heidelberg]ECT9251215.1 hypothetical protein [Salmonella enterica subsp. enterica serovar Cerro]ECV0064929.1 hypothetical protein [Salmonella enterica subsp. enterica serovar Anatum]EDD3388697.1 hypothetical protein [Salmonella enterica subsp. enterica serovar Enteritidis]HAB5454493.1 hypothetical protein [Salmonella enterica subsp. enterica]HAE1862064.1 hypothetical pro
INNNNHDRSIKNSDRSWLYITLFLQIKSQIITLNLLMTNFDYYSACKAKLDKVVYRVTFNSISEAIRNVSKGVNHDNE